MDAKSCTAFQPMSPSMKTLHTSTTLNKYSASTWQLVYTSHLGTFSRSSIFKRPLQQQQVKDERLPFFFELQDDPLRLPYLLPLCLQGYCKSFVIHLDALQDKWLHCSCGGQNILENETAVICSPLIFFQAWMTFCAIQMEMLGLMENNAMEVNGDWGCQSLTFQFVFHTRKSVILVWNNVRVRKWNNL